VRLPRGAAVRVGRMNCNWADRLVPREHLDGVHAVARIPGAAAAEVRNPTNQSPAAATKEVGMGNPAEERPPPSIISVPKLVLVVNRVVCRLM
jgi:hypothetical protein